MKNKIFLTLVLLIPSLCFGEYRESLRVNDDHRTLVILVDGPMDKNAIGLHTVDIQKAIRLKMLTYAPNLKVFNTSSGDPMPHHIIWVNVQLMDIQAKSDNILGTVVYTEIFLQKNTSDYNMKEDYIGGSFRHVFTYKRMLTVPSDGKNYALDKIKELLDDFLLDYLESNTSKPKKLKIEKLDPNKEYKFGN